MNILDGLFTQPVAQRQSRGTQKGTISVKTQREIEIMRQASVIVASVLKEISQLVQPGMTTGELDAYGCCLRLCRVARLQCA